jgi:hypothetical protein
VAAETCSDFLAEKPMADFEKVLVRSSVEIERLRALVKEGIDSGSSPLAPDDFDRIKRQGREILARRKAVR